MQRIFKSPKSSHQLPQRMQTDSIKTSWHSETRFLSSCLRSSVWVLAPRFPCQMVQAHERLPKTSSASRSRGPQHSNPSTMEGPQDDFKWFGEGFDGFPKRLPEDCVEYYLFIVDSKLKSQKQLVVSLEAVRKEAAKLTESLLKKYIWQRESFNLRVENDKGRYNELPKPGSCD